MRRWIDDGESQPGQTRGERLRRDETPSDADRRIYADYRDTFEEPLHEVGETIRRFVADAPIQSRLKRFETVVEKLRRGTSDLSRLEDIAGCRVILPTMVEQHQTRSRIREAYALLAMDAYELAERLAGPLSVTVAAKVLIRAMARMDRDVRSGELVLDVTDRESQALATLRGDDQ